MKILILLMLIGTAFTSPLDTCLFKSCECEDENLEPESTDLLKNSEPTYSLDISCLKDGQTTGVFPQRLDLPGFSEIKIGLFDLQAIGFNSIPDEVFSNLQIQYLDLNGNQLNILKNNNLKGIMGTLAIDLSNNKLQDIEDDAFQHSTFSLTSLKLDQNQLGKMNAEKLGHVLRDLNKLTSLLISENLLTEIPNLENLSSLRQLSLAKNQIEELKNLPDSITDLNLDHNRIKSIDANTFSSLKNLKYLSLDSNQITSIDSNAFRNLPELISLNLARNYLKILPEKFIFNLINLDRLDLSSQNQMLNAVPEFAFDRRSNQNFIKNLDLSGNRLNDFSPKSFCSKNASNNFINVVDLILPYNMETDVNVCWFLQLSRGFRYQFENHKNLGPKVNFKRNKLIDHMDGQIKCSCELEKARLFVNLEGSCKMDDGQLVSLATLSSSCKENFDKEQIENQCDSNPEFNCRENLSQPTTKSTIHNNDQTKNNKDQNDKDQNKAGELKEPEKQKDRTDETKNQNGQNLPTKQTIINNSNTLSANRLLQLVLSSVIVSFIL